MITDQLPGFEDLSPVNFTSCANDLIGSQLAKFPHTFGILRQLFPSCSISSSATKLLGSVPGTSRLVTEVSSDRRLFDCGQHVAWYPTRGPWYKTGVKKHKSYTITEAAKSLGVSRQAVHEAIKNGLLKAKWGEVIVTKKALLISEESLNSYQVSIRHQTAGKKR